MPWICEGVVGATAVRAACTPEGAGQDLRSGKAAGGLDIWGNTLYAFCYTLHQGRSVRIATLIWDDWNEESSRAQILPCAKGERMKQARGRKPPRFASVAEEARFWQVHSPLDYRHAFREEPGESSERLETLLAVRFDRDTVTLLRKVARAKGIGATTLLRLWTIERLTEELAPARKATARRAG
jgi:hypothetical protein